MHTFGDNFCHAASRYDQETALPSGTLLLLRAVSCGNTAKLLDFGTRTDAPHPRFFSLDVVIIINLMLQASPEVQSVRRTEAAFAAHSDCPPSSTKTVLRHHRLGGEILAHRQPIRVSICLAGKISPHAVHWQGTATFPRHDKPQCPYEITTIGSK